MNKQLEEKLKKSLRRIEEYSRKILNSRGYTRDTAQARLLEELLKEQLTSENTHSTAR